MSSFPRLVPKKNERAGNSLAVKIDMKIQRNLVAKNESVIECDARAFGAANPGP